MTKRFKLEVYTCRDCNAVFEDYKPEKYCPACVLQRRIEAAQKKIKSLTGGY